MRYTFEEARPMDELLEDFIKAIVGVPEEVEIEKTESLKAVIYSVEVVSDDMGKIIGKKGTIINSLKTIFSALGCKHGKKVHIEIRE